LLPAVLGVVRPPFLVLTPVSVFLGAAAGPAVGLSIDWTAAMFAILGALAAHVSVNALNEYGDFRSGLDFLTRRTPFSGGSGALMAHPELAPLARHIGLAAFVVTGGAGVLLLWRTGWGLLPFGLLGMVLVLSYTGPISRNRFLCLIAPGLGFGPLMVVGTCYAVTGELSGTALTASLVPFFLVNNLLLLNQFPDVDADRTVGRQNFPIKAGLSASLRVYGLFALLAYATLVVGWFLGVLPSAVLPALLTSVLAAQVYIGVGEQIRAREGESPDLARYLGLNVAVTLVTPALLALGLAWGG
jgi:1,4-dihydroxy-2-naphthoate octaprenyltransferase